MITVHVDQNSESDLIKALRGLGEVRGKPIQKMLYEEALTVTKRLIKWTPPMKAQGSDTSDRAQGMLKTESDVRRVFTTRRRLIRLIVAKVNDVSLLKGLLRPTATDIVLENYLKKCKQKGLVFANPTQEFHRKQRDSRGRVKKLHQTALGDYQAVEDFVKEKKKMVGYTRAGWSLALEKLDGRAPSWVSRHGTANGIFNDRTQDGQLPHVEVGNKTHIIAYANTEGNIVYRALEGRLDAIRKRTEILLTAKLREEGLA